MSAAEQPITAREEPQEPEVADPIVHEVTVPVSPGRAFDAFTGELATWWDPRLTADVDTFRSADVPPYPGRDVTFRHEGGQWYRIGTVTTWRPGEQFAMSFCLAMDTDHPSNLTVDFAQLGADGTTTKVTLTHAGWGPDNVVHRDKYGEWPNLLRRYAQHVVAAA